MKHTIEHDLDLVTAKKVTDRAFAEYGNRYPDYKPTLAWSDDQHADVSFSAKGVHLGGVMAIDAKSISLVEQPFELEAFLPFFFSPPSYSF